MSNLETLEALIECYKAQGGELTDKVLDRSPVVQAVGAMPYLVERCGGPVIAWDLVIDATMDAFEPGTKHEDFRAIRNYFFTSNGMAAGSVHADGMHATWLRLQEWYKQDCGDP